MFVNFISVRSMAIMYMLDKDEKVYHLNQTFTQNILKVTWFSGCLYSSVSLQHSIVDDLLILSKLAIGRK